MYLDWTRWGIVWVEAWGTHNSPDNQVSFPSFLAHPVPAIYLYKYIYLSFFFPLSCGLIMAEGLQKVHLAQHLRLPCEGRLPGVRLGNVPARALFFRCVFNENALDNMLHFFFLTCEVLFVTFGIKQICLPWFLIP